MFLHQGGDRNSATTMRESELPEGTREEMNSVGQLLHKDITGRVETDAQSNCAHHPTRLAQRSTAAAPSSSNTICRPGRICHHLKPELKTATVARTAGITGSRTTNMEDHQRKRRAITTVVMLEEVTGIAVHGAPEHQARACSRHQDRLYVLEACHRQRSRSRK